MIYGPNPKYIPPNLEEDDEGKEMRETVQNMNWVALNGHLYTKHAKAKLKFQRKSTRAEIVRVNKPLFFTVMIDLANTGNITAFNKLNKIFQSDDDILIASPTIAEFYMTGNISIDSFNLKQVLTEEQYYTGESINRDEII